MPVPRRRHCSSRQGKDRAHKKLYRKLTVPCEKCGEPKLRHRVCPACGTYKKRDVKPVVTT
ncbi:50S ribosomal protein L32 [bacterium]|nr:50S ribosomal protein L32 [bacterium]